MGLFSRKPKRPTHLPEMYLRGLRDWGEQLVGQRATSNPHLMADLDIMDFAQTAPDDYVDMLAAGIFNGPSHISGYVGACCLGAAETVTHMYELDVSTPAWNRIVDTAIEYLRNARIPYVKIKPYMKHRWELTHSPSEW